MAMTEAGKVVEGLAYLHHLGLHPASLAVLQQHGQEVIYLLTGHGHSGSLESHPATRLSQARGVYPIAVGKSLAVETWCIQASNRRSVKIEDLNSFDRGRDNREQGGSIDGCEHRPHASFRVVSWPAGIVRLRNLTYEANTGGEQIVLKISGCHSTATLD